MKLNKKICQLRNDFKGEYQCEYCDNVEVDEGLRSYDDTNYMMNVVPAKKCTDCGRSTNDLEDVFNLIDEYAQTLVDVAHKKATPTEPLITKELLTTKIRKLVGVRP